jgi:MYXO-CTERM domain-containing protein
VRTPALAALLVTALAAPAARADVRLPPPPPPPPPPGQTSAVIAAGLGVLGLGLWFARRRPRAVAAS